MTIDLTVDEAKYAHGWALAIESAKPEDRRFVAIFASAALGNLAVVRCTQHDPDIRMTFTEAYRHVVDAPSRCSLSVDRPGR